MSIFFVLSWVGWTIEVLFAILCIASGLYYIAETIEEYTESSRKIMQFMCFAVLAFTVLLWFLDGIPVTMMLMGLFANSCKNFTEKKNRNFYKLSTLFVRHALESH